MRRRDFSKMMVGTGVGLASGMATAQTTEPEIGQFYVEPPKQLPTRKFDVIVCGGGTAGVVAATAAARQGAKTALIEVKGYAGGAVTEGGTALHSFYNLWKAFPDCKKRQVVRGIPQEIIDRVLAVGGTSGHAETTARVCQRSAQDRHVDGHDNRARQLLDVHQDQL